jgi:hypothetical protein
MLAVFFVAVVACGAVLRATSSMFGAIVCLVIARIFIAVIAWLSLDSEPDQSSTWSRRECSTSRVRISRSTGSPTTARPENDSATVVGAHGVPGR